jgi:hypothetical protein
MGAMASTACAQSDFENPAVMHEKFESLSTRKWETVFTDRGTDDWRKHWVLDGERASVTNTPEGMVFAAGPSPDDHANHAVLWTNRSFSGDVKIEWDYTRLDHADRYVNILYIQATGVGTPPYAKDISTWADLRRVPAMKSYFEHMNLLHISYAAFSNDGSLAGDYVRARRYPTAPGRPFDQIDIAPDYFNTGLFIPNEVYHFTVIKTDRVLFLEVRGSDTRKRFHWPLDNVEPVNNGPIGIRHMATRSSRYANITISTPASH